MGESTYIIIYPSYHKSPPLVLFRCLQDTTGRYSQMASGVQQCSSVKPWEKCSWWKVLRFAQFSWILMAQVLPLRTCLCHEVSRRRQMLGQGALRMFYFGRVAQ